jgi:hypothetical protein
MLPAGGDEAGGGWTLEKVGFFDMPCLGLSLAVVKVSPRAGCAAAAAVWPHRPPHARAL